MVDGLLRLLSLSLSGALLTGGTALLARLLRGRISRTAAYYLWLPVLMRLLCPWGLSHTLMDRAVSSAVGEGIAVSVSLAPEEGADDPEHPSILPEVSGGETAAGAALYLWGAGFAAFAAGSGRTVTGRSRSSPGSMSGPPPGRGVPRSCFRAPPSPSPWWWDCCVPGSCFRSGS